MNVLHTVNPQSASFFRIEFILKMDYHYRSDSFSAMIRELGYCC